MERITELLLSKAAAELKRRSSGRSITDLPGPHTPYFCRWFCSWWQRTGGGSQPATGPGGAIKPGMILRLHCSKVLGAPVITAVQLGLLTFSFGFNHLAAIPSSSSSLKAPGCARGAEGICQPAASEGRDLPCC